MKCPHCTVEIHPSFQYENVCQDGRDRQYVWRLAHMVCPREPCHEMIFRLLKYHEGLSLLAESILAYPKVEKRTPLSEHIPDAHKNNYLESCDVVQISPRASAALSRTGVQMVLDHLAIKTRSLQDGIGTAIKEGKIRPQMSGLLETVRKIGNHAVHPKKDSLTGEIIPVEQKEAELLIDILECLFDDVFCRPAIIQSKASKALEKWNGHRPDTSIHEGESRAPSGS